MDQELIAYLDRRFDEQDRSIEDLKQSHGHTQAAVEDLKDSNRHTQAAVEDLKQSNRHTQAAVEDLKQSNRHAQAAVEDLKDSNRHTQVMVEGLRSDVQLVAEGVAAVDQKLERYREEVHRRRDADQASVRAGFKALRRKDDELDRRITRLETGGLPG